MNKSFDNWIFFHNERKSETLVPVITHIETSKLQCAAVIHSPVHIPWRSRSIDCLRLPALFRMKKRVLLTRFAAGTAPSPLIALYQPFKLSDKIEKCHVSVSADAAWKS